MPVRIKRVLLVILLVVSISISVIKIYEPVSTQNVVINGLKRMAAEVGRCIVVIYDPYLSKKKIAYLGPYEDLKNDRVLKIRDDFFEKVKTDDYLSSHLKIIKYDNKNIVTNNMEFDYQSFDETKLKFLREKYGLEDVVKEGESEFQKQLILKNWVRQRWSIGEPNNVSYNFNALDILERAQKGEKFFCSEYATTYVQALAALGMTARYVGLFKGHVVVEVWSNEFDKWIVMEPSFNIHYEFSGVPLNALELHNAWVNNNWENIKVIKGDFQSTTEGIIDNHQFKLIDYYENFYIRMRNDWFSNIYPHWYPKANSIMNGIEWQDKFTKNNILVARETNRKEDLYWTLNHVYLKLINYDILEDKVILKFRMDTVTPNFDKFLIKINEKEIINTVQSNFDWELHKGVNTLETASVNKFGIEGILTRISINYE